MKDATTDKIAANESPVFIVGAERSGTTLLRLMLDHHPRFKMLSEFEYAVDQIDGGDTWPNVADYAQHLSTHRIFAEHQFEIDESLTYPALIRSFLAQFGDGHATIGATVHKHYDRTLRIWPQARFIKLLRDGRDVARSSVQMGWAGNVWFGVQRWIDAERIWNDVSSRVPNDRWIVVRYEDLISDCENELQRVCAFLGDQFDPAMFNYANHSTYDRPDPSLIYQWKKKMSAAEIQLVEARIGDMLIDRGYERSEHAPVAVSPAEQKKLGAANRRFIIKTRIERYGVWLWFCDALARRIGTRSWQRRTQLKINAIDLTHLR